MQVNFVLSHIFWTDWYRHGPKIERANMDGTQRIVIVDKDIGLPNGLYYDSRRAEVCWGDALTKKIECVSRDGTSRRVVAHINKIHPFDITEIGNNIYWSDWSKQVIQALDKNGVNGEELKLAPGGNGRVFGIAVVKNACPRGKI